MEKQFFHIRIDVMILQIVFLLVFVSQIHAQTKLTLDDIFIHEKFKLNDLAGFQWVPNQNQFTYLKKLDDSKFDIHLYNIQTTTDSILVDWEKIPFLISEKKEKRFSLQNYLWSPDGRMILFPDENSLHLLDVKSGELKLLLESESEIRDPQFSPDSKKLMYLRDFNIWVLDLEQTRESQITTQGFENFWIGRFDWVYEEEFGIRTGFFWSPDSRYIAYYQLDARHEHEFPIVDFIPAYNTVKTLRYPKAGEKNAIVKIGVADSRSGKTVWMNTGEETNVYFPRIKWLNNSKQLLIYRMNRLQNKLELLLANRKDGKTKIILTEEEENGWLDLNTDILFLNDGQHFLWRSDRDGWQHIYLYKLTGEMVRQVTCGEWETEQMLAVDSADEYVYFTANRRSALENHLYRVPLSGGEITCLTGAEFSHKIKLAPGCRYFVDWASNANQPEKIKLWETSGKFLTTLEENNLDAFQEYRFAKREFLTFTTEDGEALNAFMIRPQKMELGEKYPVLIHVYGGPGSKMVNNAWRERDAWFNLLTEKGYLIFGVDVRGTRGRGAGFMKQVYRDLGHFEVADHVAAVKFLRTLPFVDPERIGLWGWSYGGYTVSMCMLKAPEYFKCGVAVAPVTDWRNYDSIYTERFMGLPMDNEEGYQNSSALNFVKNLQGKLLLIHGAADDNVHLANTMQLVFELQKANKVFEMAVYPQKKHGISGVHRQLYEVMLEFIFRNL